jgi:hypothetical protein
VVGIIRRAANNAVGYGFADEGAVVGVLDREQSRTCWTALAPLLPPGTMRGLDSIQLWRSAGRISVRRPRLIARSLPALIS